MRSNRVSPSPNVRRQQRRPKKIRFLKHSIARRAHKSPTRTCIETKGRSTLSMSTETPHYLRFMTQETYNDLHPQDIVENLDEHIDNNIEQKTGFESIQNASRATLVDNETCTIL